jgi:hypothetical protein
MQFYGFAGKNEWHFKPMLRGNKLNAYDLIKDGSSGFGMVDITRPYASLCIQVNLLCLGYSDQGYFVLEGA